MVASIRELAAQTNTDIVHAHGYKADIYAYYALRGTATPLVSTCHTWYDNDLLVTLYGMADRLVLRNYAAVVAVSGEVKQRLLKAGVHEERIHLVRNGIDLRPFDNAQPSLRSGTHSNRPPIVGLVGRLSIEKGVDIFLHAAARVLAELPSTKFVVVGEGPDRDKLESLIDELKIGESVSMLGRRDDMPSIYASLDIMVSASRQEGLPMAILEGMASRLPLMATAVGEVPTVVLDGRTGVLFLQKVGSNLWRRNRRAVAEFRERERFGARREIIEEEFSADRMTADYLRVYEQAAARKRQ